MSSRMTFHLADSSVGGLLVASGLITLVIYNVALAIYRLSLHPLAKFPGPKLAAASGWYEFYHDILRRGRFMWHIKDLHDQYGPIVRVTPHELHILDPDFFDDIYAPSSKRRDKWEGFVVMAGAPGATFSAASHDLHRLRRGVLNPFFSKRAIANNETQIMDKVQHLCRRLTEVANSGQATRIDAAYSALTMDIIAQYTFGESYHQLDAPDWKIDWKNGIVGASANGVVLRQFPWSLPILQNFPLSILKMLDPNIAQIVQWQNAMKLQSNTLFANQRADKKAEGTIFQAILDSDLPRHEITPQRLADEAQTIVGAGSETTAKALSFISFFLYSNPEKLNRLREELASVKANSDGSFPLAQLEKLPYLTACITEAVRMTSGVTARLPRVAHEPFRYKDWTIPSGTPVSQCHYFVNNDPTLFPNPLTYRPERWIEAADQNVRLEKYMVSFGRGSRSCVGINLAWAELYLTLAHVVTRFEMAPYETTVERDVLIDRDFFVGVPRDDSLGIRMKIAVR